nr:alpha-glucosidase-like [Ziziphus jujuba var. spinosa]
MKKRANLLEIPCFLVVLGFLFLGLLNGSNGQDPIGFGYSVRSVVSNDTGKFLTAKLELINGTNTFGPDVQSLTLTASYDTKDRLRIRITDAKTQRWEISHDIIPRPFHPTNPLNHDHLSPPSENLSSPSENQIILSDPNSELVFTLHNTTPFSFTVSRNCSGDVLFDTSPNGSNPDTFFIFKDQYIQLSSSLPDNNRSSLYGLGERTRSSFKLTLGQNFTLWNSDIPSSRADVNLYGSHPFYLDVRSASGDGKAAAGTSHGVLLLNSDGMDIVYGGDPCCTTPFLILFSRHQNL